MLDDRVVQFGPYCRGWPDRHTPPWQGSDRTERIPIVQELEIKLQIPPDRLNAVRAELERAPVQHVHLQAAYVDTDDRRLAAARMALRVRREGPRCVQTLKAALDGMLTRFEHNVELDADADLAADPARHDGTPGGESLRLLLANGAPLREMYRTDVHRSTRRVRSRRGTVELALDTGWILSGERRLPVCELEVESVSGSPLAVIDVARRWVQRHGLWLDVRSKAEAGDRLSRGIVSVPAVRGTNPVLQPEWTASQAWQAVLRSLLGPMLTLQSELSAPGAADTSQPHRMEQVHQLRVGLRRLRSAIRLFDGWPGVTVPEGLASAAAAVFSQLGGSRDLDVASEMIGPVLAAVGMPPVPWHAAPAAPDPAQVLRGAAAQALWLDLLACAHDEGASGDAQPADAQRVGSEPTLQQLATRRIRRWHKAVTREADHFWQLDDKSRHALRKRIKRLRYAVDFMGSLYPRKRVKRYLTRLADAQEAFGQFNDLCMADVLLRELDDPAAWYARGWLAGRRQTVLTPCHRCLVRLAKAPVFWP